MVVEKKLLLVMPMPAATLLDIPGSLYADQPPQPAADNHRGEPDANIMPLFLGVSQAAFLSCGAFR